MINENLNTIAKLQAALIAAEAFVSAFPKETPYQNFETRSTLDFFTPFRSCKIHETDH